MKKYIIVYISVLIVSNFFYTNSFAYNFDYNNKHLNICDTNKSKIDNLINSKIKTLEKAKSLTKRLDKYNANKLNPIKKGIYFYIKYALEKKIEQFNNSQANLNPNFGTGTLVKVDYSNYNTNTISDNAYSGQNTQDVGINNVYPQTYNTQEQLPINESFNIEEPNFNKGVRINTIDNLSSSKKVYIEAIKSITKEYVEVNDNWEFEELGKKYLVDLKEYWLVEFNNPVSTYKNIKGITNEVLIKKGNNFLISSGGYNFENKLSIKDIANKVKLVDNWNEDLIYYNIENGFYYSYDISNFYFYNIIGDGIYLSKHNLERNIEDCLLFKKGNEYMLADKYEEKKLFSTELLNTMKDPKKFLMSIIGDVRNYQATELESGLINIKTKTLELYKKSQDDTILEIYKYITKNINYDSFTMDFFEGKINEQTFLKQVNKDVYSGIMTFKNKNGVCDGFSKLLHYMTLFAGIDKASIELGKVQVYSMSVDHAWNKIGDYLYDSTWDIYSKGDISKFKYYKLTEEQMYKDHFR